MSVGVITGSGVGSSTGSEEGLIEGSQVGGVSDGEVVLGAELCGDLLGITLGDFEGRRVEGAVGDSVGLAVG